jgi:hypothetical protein
LVDWRGIEPLTSAMPRRRYTANLPAQPTQNTGTIRLNLTVIGSILLIRFRLGQLARK